MHTIDPITAETFLNFPGSIRRADYASLKLRFVQASADMVTDKRICGNGLRVLLRMMLTGENYTFLHLNTLVQNWCDVSEPTAYKIMTRLMKAGYLVGVTWKPRRAFQWCRSFKVLEVPRDTSGMEDALGDVVLTRPQDLPTVRVKIDATVARVTEGEEGTTDDAVACWEGRTRRQQRLHKRHTRAGSRPFFEAGKLGQRILGTNIELKEFSVPENSVQPQTPSAKGIDFFEETPGTGSNLTSDQAPASPGTHQRRSRRKTTRKGRGAGKGSAGKRGTRQAKPQGSEGAIRAARSNAHRAEFDVRPVGRSAAGAAAAIDFALNYTHRADDAMRDVIHTPYRGTVGWCDAMIANPYFAMLEDLLGLDQWTSRELRMWHRKLRTGTLRFDELLLMWSTWHSFRVDGETQPGMVLTEVLRRLRLHGGRHKMLVAPFPLDGVEREQAVDVPMLMEAMRTGMTDYAVTGLATDKDPQEWANRCIPALSTLPGALFASLRSYHFTAGRAFPREDAWDFIADSRKEVAEVARAYVPHHNHLYYVLRADRSEDEIAQEVGRPEEDVFEGNGQWWNLIPTRLRRRARSTGEAALRDTTPALFDDKSGVIDVDVFGNAPGDRVYGGAIPTIRLKDMTVAEAMELLEDLRRE